MGNWSLRKSTGYVVNPARDLEPRLAHAFLPIAGKGSSDIGNTRGFLIGPFIGGTLAAYVVNGVF